MCGIAGFIARPADRPSPDLLRRICDTLTHRGPDAFGSFIDHRVALGHRRLSIIDLATGDQPIGNEDGRLQVVFNGEIYNHVELRQDLERRGHHFATKSDTEVLVHLYEECGPRMPEHLNGMFAFALWDRKEEVLFLARDRTGEKPLYYTSSNVRLEFAFASELKSLVELGGSSGDLNAEAVA